jgi:hypothetical protein
MVEQQGQVCRTNHKRGHKRGGKSVVSYNEKNIKQALTDHFEGKSMRNAAIDNAKSTLNNRIKKKLQVRGKAWKMVG